jgi:DNA-binding XRE family transcriptional regulator
VKKKAVPNVLLRQARTRRNLSQRRLAEIVDADEQTVGSWERGTRFPSLEMRQRLCDLFEKTPEELGLQLPEEVSHSQELSVSPSLSDEPVLFPSLTEGRGPGQERIIALQVVSSPLENKSRDENRRPMLQRVRSLWITGVFDHSLFHEMLITLGLQVYFVK